MSHKLKPPKNNKTRYATLSPHLTEEIKHYILDMGISGPLFKAHDGNYRSYGSVRHHYINDMAAAGVPVTKLHNFRRFFITTFIENGGNEAHLRKLVGHVSKEMTNAYTVLRDNLGELSTVVNI